MAAIAADNPPQDEIFSYSSVPLPSNSGYIRVLELFPSTTPGEPLPSSSGFDTPLRCRLFATPLDHGHQYQALSYTWGKPKFTHRLEIDNSHNKTTPPSKGRRRWVSKLLQLKHQPLDRNKTIGCAPAATGNIKTTYLNITPSLDQALRHIRHEHQPITVWVDQICINQDPTSSEKGAQVGMMGDIYSRASSVIIWLGPADTGSDRLLDSFGTIARLCQECGLDRHIGGKLTLPSGEPNPDVMELRDLVLGVNPGLLSSPFGIAFRDFISRARVALFGDQAEEEGHAEVARMLSDFTSRPWFSRLWVLQEFALGRSHEFICGRKRLGTDQFVLGKKVWKAVRMEGVKASLRRPLHERRMAIDWGDRYNGPIDRLLGLVEVYNSTSEVKQLRGEFGRSKQRDTLLDLIRVCHRGDWPQIFSTDPRDRIYSLLGLCSDAESLGLGVPDYSSAMTTGRLLTDVTRRTIEIGGDLTVLELVRFPKRIDASSSKDTGSSNELPSWVPDFFCPQHSYSHAKNSNTGKSAWLFSPTGLDRRPRVISTDNDERILGLEGICVDIVEQVANPWLPSNSKMDIKRITGAYAEYALTVYSLLKLSLKKVTPPGHCYDMEQRLEAPWRVMTGGIEQTYQGLQRATASGTKGPMEGYLDTCATVAESYSSAGSQLRQLLYSLRISEDAEGPERRRSGFPLPYELSSAIREAPMQNRMDAMRNERPFLTEQVGYLGMGPMEMQPGDLLVAFYGARVMYVVRPVPERGERLFTFVGEAYCDGVMDGEILDRGVAEEFYLV